MIKDEHDVQKEEEQEEFHEQAILFSYNQGTEYKPETACMYRDSGLGYLPTAGRKFQIILESGYTLCRYALPTRWQIEEACRRLAPCANYRGPADQIFPTYRREHAGEKLSRVIETIFIEVYTLAQPLKEERSQDEHLEAIKDWVLERGDASNDQPPLLAF
ncbi:MAG: hypothetical protein ACRDIV_17700 [Ktedonobacteraceae bacterium]